MPRSPTPAISPFLIVSDVARATAFYVGLGFEVTYREPANGPFFAIVRRDGAQIFLKSHEGLAPLPNSARHPWMRFDAVVYAPDPDSLAAEFEALGATFSELLKDTDDGQRGFEITDPDGHVLFFGRPR